MRIFIRACTLPVSTDTTSKPSNDGGQPSPNALNSSSVRGRLSIPLIIFDGRSVIWPTLSQLAPVNSTSLVFSTGEYGFASVGGYREFFNSAVQFSTTVMGEGARAAAAGSMLLTRNFFPSAVTS